MATSAVAAKPKPASAELARLRAENAELEREVERLENCLLDLEVLVLDGYAVALWPVGNGTFIGTCPRLHASVQEDSKEETLSSLQEAMDVVREGMATVGWEVPAPDVQPIS